MSQAKSRQSITWPMEWLRLLWSRRWIAEAQASLAARQRKLPPITTVLERAGREPLAPD